MRYGAYSSSELKSSSEYDVKEKSNSSSWVVVSGSRGVRGGDGVEMSSILLSGLNLHRNSIGIP